MSEATLMDVVREAEASFTTKVRDNGVRFVLTTDDAPEWVSEMCRTAHADMLPDDTRYNMIRAAVDALAEADDDADADALSRQRDAMPSDPAYSDLVTWLSTYAGVRLSYCDDAADEYGIRDTDTATRLEYGMTYEMSEVFDLVLSAIVAEWESRQNDAGHTTAAFLALPLYASVIVWACATFVPFVLYR